MIYNVASSSAALKSVNKWMLDKWASFNLLTTDWNLRSKLISVYIRMSFVWIQKKCCLNNANATFSHKQVTRMSHYCDLSQCCTHSGESFLHIHGQVRRIVADSNNLEWISQLLLCYVLFRISTCYDWLLENIQRMIKIDSISKLHIMIYSQIYANNWPSRNICWSYLDGPGIRVATL